MKDSNNLDNHKNKNLRMILIALISLIAFCALITLIIAFSSLSGSSNTTVLSPDFAPKQEEKYAEDIGDSGDEKLKQSEGGGAVSLTYSTNVSVSLSAKQISLLFGNPTKSNQDMLVQVVVHDTVIAQSGKLSPGKQIKKLDLLKDTEKLLEVGGYKGKLVILYYQPDSGKKAIVNTEIPMQIIVKE